MTLLKTIGYAFCITILFALILSNNILEISAFTEFVIFALVGLALYFIFGPDEHLQSVTTVFIASAIVLIITGFLGNAAAQILDAMTRHVAEVQGQMGAGMPTSNIATLFGQRNVLAGTLLLFVGMFGPALAIQKFKEKMPLDYGVLLRSAVSVAIIYVIALIIYTITMSHVIGGAVLR
jgi:hypothetical protein